MKKFWCLLLLLPMVMMGCKKNETESEPEAVKLSVNPSSVICPAFGGDYQLSLTAPAAWEASCADSWVKVSPSSGNAGTIEVSVKIAANKESSESNSKIVFKSGNETVEVPVKRAAKDPARLMIIGETELLTPKEGASYTIQVESNIKWQVGKDVNWVTIEGGNAVFRNNAFVTLTVSPSTIPENTVGTITFTPLEGKEAEKQTVTIVRGGTEMTSLFVSDKLVKSPADGGSFKVVVSSNCKWRASVPWDAEWLTIDNPTGENYGSFNIDVKPSNTTDKTTAVVTLEEVRDDYYQAAKVQITVEREGQKQAILYIPESQTSIHATEAGGDFEVNLSCNYSWKATPAAAKYVSLSKTSGEGNACLVITVKPATDENAIQTKVIISTTSNYNDKSVTIYITREGLKPVAPEAEGPESKYVPKPFSCGVGKYIYFSPGNLQYQASTKTFRFAERQWAYIGEYNKYISESYTGWIDLFGWGTGLNPTFRSVESSVYKIFADWGDNPISNGGNVAGQWRTPTEYEMGYIRGQRDHWDKLCALGTVNGVKGLILLPDNWVLPTGLSFTPEDLTCTKNVYSGESWQKMEAAGAVFLPCAGSRYSSQVYSIGESGFYWTAQSDYYQQQKRKGEFVFWENAKPRISDSEHPESGTSVRLVQDVK